MTKDNFSNQFRNKKLAYKVYIQKYTFQQLTFACIVHNINNIVNKLTESLSKNHCENERRKRKKNEDEDIKLAYYDVENIEKLK